jgi:hypothetical protein
MVIDLVPGRTGCVRDEGSLRLEILNVGSDDFFGEKMTGFGM